MKGKMSITTTKMVLYLTRSVISNLVVCAILLVTLSSSRIPSKSTKMKNYGGSAY